MTKTTEAREQKFPLKTSSGCRRLLALFLCGVLLFSFCAALISSNFGKVKISSLTIDARGAELDLDLYIPAGTSDSDSLPCLILGHGRGATKNVMRGIAEELSRRGYVVLNVNAYGMGLSEQPIRDDGGNGAENFGLGGPFGLYDALEFARGLSYVDDTRIAMLGHSFGSGRTGATAVLDCGYLTLNDKLINILAETFGQTFTEGEITQDADQLAQARLNTDQLAHYQMLRDAAEAEHNTRLNTIILTSATSGPANADVTVGGYEVQRPCQVNVTFVDGKYDSLGAGAMWNGDGTTVILGDPVKMETWYSISSQGNSYTEIGPFNSTTTSGSVELAEAFANRTARLVCYNSESHSKQYFSSATISDTIRILEQAFPAGTAESSTEGMNWWLRAVCNLLAMLCMLAAVIALAGLLLSTKFFEPCVMEPHSTSPEGKNKLVYWIFAAVTVVFTIVALYQANTGGPVWANPFGKKLPSIFRLVSTSAIAFWFVVWLAGGALAMLAAKAAISKKNSGSWGLKELNLTASASAVGKTILLGVICVTFANLLLTSIGRLFNQDFRFWQMMFTEMKIEHWLVALPYVVLFFVLYLVIGMSINYGAEDVLSGRKEIILTVVINSIGVSLLCLFCYIMWFVNWTGAAISDFTLSYSMLLFVPVTVYITRKMYKVTNSVWLGAFLNAVLLAWSLVSSAGIADKYYGQGIISLLFGV